MRFAFVDGERREAEKGLSGTCIGCGDLMTPKCGPIKVKHWSHKSTRECDQWWEHETEWHRKWKNLFPSECQEVRQKDDTGEWHIADVVTKGGCVLEFQHSFLNHDERRARNRFYGAKLIWVVDGLRRCKDKSDFEKALKNTTTVFQDIQLLCLSPSKIVSALLRDWSDCVGPVFFDFGTESPLWCLFPKSQKSAQYLWPFSRWSFVQLLNGIPVKGDKTFSDILVALEKLISVHENPIQQFAGSQSASIRLDRPAMRRQIVIPQNPSVRFLNYLNRSPRGRRRF